MNNPKKIVIHHSATLDGIVHKDFDAIRNYHIETNGWKDIGYHYVIESVNNGYQIIKGRDEKQDGAHCINHNTSSIGICLVGNFNTIEPSEGQLKKLVELIKDIYSRYGVLPLYQHKDLYATSCAGNLFNMERVKSMLSEKEVHWAKKFMEYLNSKGYDIKEERFDDALTRGEAFKLLAMAEGYKG